MWLLLALILCCPVWSLQVTGILAADLKDYCQSEYFNVTCQRNDVILMEHAQYGRMRAGRCVSGSYGVVGCSVDVLSFFDRKCSGRKQCNVYVGDPLLHKLEPCSKDFTTYLEAKYMCLSVASGSLAACQRDNYSLLGPGHDVSRPGYIASASATEQGGLGTAVCPWRIKVSEGQTVRLSLLSFGGKRSVDDEESGSPSSLASGVAPPPEVCYEIGEIKDGGRSSTLSMCGGSSRESVVYSSTGHDVILQLLSAEVLRGLAPFVVKYEVQGCAKLRNPVGGYARVHGDTATVQCNVSKETWNLICNGTHWVGRVGNCSLLRGVPGQTEGIVSLMDTADTFPYGILIVVAIGVALGVLIGGILLSLVAYYMKRRRGTMRRYVTDDVMKQTTGSVDDDDVYNHETMTSATTPGGVTGGSGRMLVSHYNMAPHQFPLLQGATVAYMPHHHHHHLLHSQHVASIQSTNSQWIGGETTAIEEDNNSACCDEVDGQANSFQTTTRPSYPTTSLSGHVVVGRQTPMFVGRQACDETQTTNSHCTASDASRHGQCGADCMLGTRYV